MTGGRLLSAVRMAHMPSAKLRSSVWLFELTCTAKLEKLLTVRGRGSELTAL